jgi:hypothetical protein
VRIVHHAARISHRAARIAHNAARIGPISCAYKSHRIARFVALFI